MDGWKDGPGWYIQGQDMHDSAAFMLGFTNLSQKNNFFMRWTFCNGMVLQMFVFVGVMNWIIRNNVFFMQYDSLFAFFILEYF